MGSFFRHKIELVVLQSTSYCNLNCDYCYLPDRKLSRRMSSTVLDTAIRKILQSQLTDANPIFLWHAGEPLLAGLQFYEEAVSLVRKYSPPATQVEHSIQTNATVLTNEWCRFIRAEKFHVGVSLDGPQFLHDKHRRTWKNRGTFEKAMAGVERLREHEIDFGVLAVLTADSLAYPDEIYDFFKSIGCESVGFNVEEVENVHTSSSFHKNKDFGSARIAYAHFFARLMQRVRNDPAPLRIREIEHFLKAILRIRKNPRYVFEPMEASPLRIITILYDGDVSSFSPEFAGSSSRLYENFKIGNICVDSLEGIARRLDKSLLNLHCQASRNLCQQLCRYFQVCGGTYFSNKWSENGNLVTHETLACQLHSQAVIDAFLNQINPRRSNALNS